MPACRFDPRVARVVGEMQRFRAVVYNIVIFERRRSRPTRYWRVTHCKRRAPRANERCQRHRRLSGICGGICASHREWLSEAVKNFRREKRAPRKSRAWSRPSCAGTRFVPASVQLPLPRSRRRSLRTPGKQAALPSTCGDRRPRLRNRQRERRQGAMSSPALEAASMTLYASSPRLTGVVSVDPFFAKIIASSWAGSVWLGLADSSWTAPGGSKNISPTL